MACSHEMSPSFGDTSFPHERKTKLHKALSGENEGKHDAGGGKKFITTHIKSFEAEIWRRLEGEDFVENFKPNYKFMLLQMCLRALYALTSSPSRSSSDRQEKKCCLIRAATT